MEEDEGTENFRAAIMISSSAIPNLCGYGRAPTEHRF